jgi:hypothetical protein
MFAQQGEFGFLFVIEKNLFPIAFGMASFTLAAEMPFMRLLVIFLVTRTTEFRRVLVLLVDVAFIALHIIVLAQQLEVSLVVIKLRRLPVFLAMAFRAVCSQLAFMRLFVVLFMTGHTSLGRIFVLAVDVTLVALHIKVLAQQLEIGLAVIKVGSLPIFLDVALGAVGTQAAFMLVIFLMATNTSRSSLTIFFTFNMTALALHLLVEMAAL